MTALLRCTPVGNLLKTAWCVATLSTLLAGGTATGAEPAERDSRRDAAPPNEPVQLPPELQAIQRSLGGSTLNQFPALRDDAGPLRSRLQAGSREGFAGRLGNHRDEIRALREAATQLDGSANRLESLELYAQADALRQLAQQIRIDARGLTAGSDPAIAPTPNAPMPMPEVQPDEFQPARQSTFDQPASSSQSIFETPGAPSPSLAPEPRPENRVDPPKPQPLMDSPQAEPKPDVEIEG